MQRLLHCFTASLLAFTETNTLTAGSHMAGFSIFLPSPRPTVSYFLCQQPLTSCPHRARSDGCRRHWEMAAYSLESYKSQEGFSDDFSVSLPDDVIYASLRRKAEQMCIDAALAICTELTGNNLSSTPTTKALAALTPRDIVRHVLSALRDDPTMGGKVVVEHASDRNRFKRCSPEILLQWLSTSEFKYLLDVSSFFVAPMPSYTRDRRRCIVSCVVNTSMDAKHGLSFNIALDSNEVWKIDSVFPS